MTRPTLSLSKNTDRRPPPRPVTKAKVVLVNQPVKTRNQPAKAKSPDRQAAQQYLLSSPTYKQQLPLAIGFHKQALNQAPEDITRSHIRQLIWWLCQSNAYRRQLVPGAIRYDWEGKPAGVVTEEEVSQCKPTKQG